MYIWTLFFFFRPFLLLLLLLLKGQLTCTVIVGRFAFDEDEYAVILHEKTILM